jgi:hypothetical protein
MSEDEKTAADPDPEPEQRGDGQNEDLDPEEQGEAVLGGGFRPPINVQGRQS